MLIFDGPACHYFNVKPIHISVTDKYQVNVKEMKQAITKHTILLVASAPQYPHGILDPIEEISALAVEKHLPFHVDACVGGFMLPWVKKLGYPVPNFDFSVNGVTSISVDLHKYGFSQKGASLILYRDESIRQYQYFAYSQWPGGLFVSPSMLGTRSGGVIAASWAALCAQGQEGYIAIAKTIMETTTYLIQEINKIPNLYILGNPVMTVIAFSAQSPLNIYVVSDIMESKFGIDPRYFHLIFLVKLSFLGWKTERQHNPSSLHLTLTPPHAQQKEKFIQDLKKSVEIAQTQSDLNKKGMAGVYGMVASIPSNVIIDHFLISYMSKLFDNKN